MARDVALIINPTAGGGRAAKALPRLAAALRAQGVGVHVERTRSLDHARELARAAGAAGEVAAACGGDGIVGAVAGELVGTDGVLAILPGGRGNDFARTLGIPKDPEGAAAVVARARERTIDVGEVAGHRFVGIASCGFDSDANRIANATRMPGEAAYLYGLVRALVSWRPAHFELELDGVRRRHEGYSVAAANGQAYGGGMRLAPGAELDDGLFDVVTIGRVGKLRLVSRVPQVFKGTHVNNAEVVVERARELRIAADRPFAVYADGEQIAQLPAVVRTLPAAVRVLVP